jgi:hypothetical protein
VQNDVVETFGGLLRQIEIEPDGSQAGIAAAPLGFHALHKKTVNADIQFLFPLGNSILTGVQTTGCRKK